jgi:hypothetical protein
MEQQDSYPQALRRFDTLVSAATAVSQGAADRPSETPRHYWASVLYTRVCVNSVSLLFLLPRNRYARAVFDHWDVTAVASLARDIVEGYLAFYYLCVDSVDQDEWNCRWNVFNLHDCVSRQRLFERFDCDTEQVARFVQTAEELRRHLRRNRHFRSLSEKSQNLLLKGRNAYLFRQDEIIKRTTVDANYFRAMYEFLSTQIHALPMSFYRTGDKNRGRGLENEIERDYICWIVDFTESFVRRATKEIIELFPGADAKVSASGRRAIYLKPSPQRGTPMRL